MLRRLNHTAKARRTGAGLVLTLLVLLPLMALPAAAYYASPGQLMIASWVMVIASSVGLVAMFGALLAARRRDSAFDIELRQLIEVEATRWR
jgi:hypothetical protein